MTKNTMKTKKDFPGRFTWVRNIEVRIEQRLGRKMLLEDFSDIELEQLWYLVRYEPDDSQLSKALNDMLEGQYDDKQRNLHVAQPLRDIINNFSA